MAYRNAQDIFPEELLRQIQRYVSGETIYVPAREEKKAWGETSGYQQYIRERNREIRQGFEQGKTIDQLMDKYALSYDSIKRIVYSRKEIAMLKYSATLSSARAYGQAGKTDAWLHLYLNEDGRNIPFSDGLKLFDHAVNYGVLQFLNVPSMFLANRVVFCRLCVEDGRQVKVWSVRQCDVHKRSWVSIFAQGKDGRKEAICS